MSKKSKTAIVVGALVFILTLVVAIVIFLLTAVSGPEIMNSPQRQVEKAEAAQTILAIFIFAVVMELAVTSMLAYRWNKPGIPGQTPAGELEARPQELTSRPINIPLFTGLVAFVTSFVESLLSVFVFDVGGLSPNALICIGIPAVIFGMLGGFLWGKIRKTSSFSRVDLVFLILIGILAGIIPVVVVRLLPQ